MTPEQREKLDEQIRDIDSAIVKLDAARKPFDDAIHAVYMVKENLLEEHAAVMLGRCETCASLIVEGDLAHSTEDVFFCKEHAPTWGDIRKQATEASPDDWEDADGRELCLSDVDEYIADGGALTDKRVWKH